MTMVVLLLVLIWAAALVPIALKKRAEWEITASVTRFRHRAGLLRRAYPRLVAVAGTSLSSPGIYEEVRSYQLAPTRSAGRYSRAKLEARRERRRRTLLILGSTVGLTLVLGAVPALRLLWVISLIALVLTVAYVALLVHFTRLEAYAAERANKVVSIGGVRIPFVASEQYAAVAGRAIVELPSRPSFVLVEAPS